MGGHRFLMNAYGGGGSFTFQTIDRGGGHEFFRQSETVFVIVNALNQEDANGCILNIHEYKRVFGKGGSMLFFPPSWGRVMQFYHLGMGGVNIFFLTPRRCLPPPPSAEIYEQYVP